MAWRFGKGEKSSRDPVGALIQDLRSANPEICRKAVELAGEQRLRAAVPALVELLYLKDKRVIAAAAHALGEIGDLRAVQHLGEASYAHDCLGPVLFRTLTPTGEVVEPSEKDVLMARAVNDAENKLWHQPGAEQYRAQLGGIKMYTFGDFWRSDNILIDPDVQN